MKKWSINYILFILLSLLVLIQAISGFLLWFVIAGGHRGFGISRASQPTELIWSRYTWIEIHDWSAVALVVVVILHIIVHWKWIVYMTKKVLGTQSS